MISKKDCLLYLEFEKSNLIKEYPKFESITEELFAQINNFINVDFDGISENRIYRLFLEKLKDIIQYSLDNSVSKKYMRNFFIKLNNKNVTDYLKGIMKAKSVDINNVMERFVNLFVYWQNSDNTRDQKTDEIIKLVDGWM